MEDMINRRIIEMREVTIFIKTGERRKPKEGEWFRNNFGNFTKNINSCLTNSDSVIVTKYEIEIPEGAEGIDITPFTSSSNDGKDFRYIYPSIFLSLKKKIKKWIWRIERSSFFITEKPMSEKEMINFPFAEKVEGTEIEVEE